MTKNPRWTAPAAPDPDDRTVWDEGTSAQRLEWFRALRRADPAAARNLLADNYSRESVGNRVEFLGVLADGLSGADQDFLLAAVGDRSRAVAAAAITLLTRLPDSPLRRDMRTLAARHLTIGRRLLRTTVTVTDLRAGDFAPWPIPDGDPWTVLLGRIDPAEWPQIFGGDLLNLIAAGSEELHAAVSRIPAGGDHLPARRAGAGPDRRDARQGSIGRTRPPSTARYGRC